MKSIFFLTLISVCGMNLFSQAKLEVATGTTITTSDAAYIVMDDVSLDNDGVIKQARGDGSFKFTGNQENFLSGKGLTSFDRLVLEKPFAHLLLQTNIIIAGELRFDGGRFNLKDHIVNLGNSGYLSGESEVSHLFSTGRGYIESLHDTRGAVTINPGNLGAVISSGADLGNTIIRRGHLSQRNMITGNESILRYYDIIPTKNANLDATVRFQYFDSEVNDINEDEFTLLKSADGISWTNLGMDARNGKANYVEKKGLTQFSRITLSTNLPDGRWRSGNFAAESFAIWPNPVVEIVTLAINAAQPANMKVLIYDGKGALVQVQDAKLGAGTNQVKVNMNKLPQGNYSIHANYDGKTKISRVNKM